AQPKIERISQALDQADQWLENSVSSVELARQAVELMNSTGAAVDPELIDRVRSEAESLRAQLGEARELVAKIKGSTGDIDDDKTLEARMDQAAQMAIRVIATLGSID